MPILENYEETLQKLYDHVGFKPDYVVYPIDNNTDAYWYINSNNDVCYSESLKILKNVEAGKYYCGSIYTQRFYNKHVYEGKNYTMIFLDTHTDGMKYFAFFDNKKKVNKSEIEIDE